MFSHGKSLTEEDSKRKHTTSIASDKLLKKIKCGSSRSIAAKCFPGGHSNKYRKIDELNKYLV